MDWLPINFAIISHPINWLTVLLMVAIAGLAIETLSKYFKTDSTSEQG